VGLQLLLVILQLRLFTLHYIRKYL